ncbi:MAG: rRNA maturation RNase YbeY [Candidatus Gastranaerophilales bacterium]|nr:rRNA maturation RNase YbeY [Candidatus Gastranaerophilales bacterium]
MYSVFTLEKLDNVKIILKDYKPKIKKMMDIILEIDELKTNKIFSENISKIRFDIAFCNDETIWQINKEYRQKDSPTDVITFSLFADDENALIYRKTADLGQIIVSVETAKKQAKESLEREILTLICHGVLHLFGFDHLTKKDYDFVVGIQNRVMERL